MNSCDEELQQKIEEKTLQFGVKHKMGIVYFYTMINLIQSSSAPMMQVLTKKLETLMVTDFPGENVVTASSFVKGATQQLGLNAPQDIISLMKRPFKGSSMDEFNKFIKLLYSIMKWN